MLHSNKGAQDWKKFYQSGKLFHDSTFGAGLDPEVYWTNGFTSKEDMKEFKAFQG